MKLAIGTTLLCRRRDSLAVPVRDNWDAGWFGLVISDRHILWFDLVDKSRGAQKYPIVDLSQKRNNNIEIFSQPPVLEDIRK